MTETSQTTETPDYMQTYDTYWKRIVENEDGTLNKDQVARELADALTLQGHLSEVYCEVSGSAVSKPFTLPSVVISLYYDSLTEAGNRAIDDLIGELEQAEHRVYELADVVALVRELTGREVPAGEG